MLAQAGTEPLKGAGGGQHADASAALDAHEVPAHEAPRAPPEASRLRQQARLQTVLSAAALSWMLASAQPLLRRTLLKRVADKICQRAAFLDDHARAVPLLEKQHAVPHSHALE